MKNGHDFLPTDTNEDTTIHDPSKYAAIYARKSTQKKSHSIESQLSRGKEVINEHSLVLYDTYFDTKSASLYPYTERGGFCRLLKDMGDNKFKTVVVLKRDRLSRQFPELLKIRKMFKEKGVKLIYSAPGEYQSDESSCYSDFIENIIMGISDFEAKMVKERTSTGKEMKFKNKEYSSGGNVPFGFIKNSDEVNVRGKEEYDLIVHEENAKIVTCILEEYVSKDYTLKDLTQFANSLFTDNTTLSREKVTSMLTNPVYAAIQRPKKENELFIYDDSTHQYFLNEEEIHTLTNVEPIIKRELWIKAALKYINNKIPHSKSVEDYLFKELLKCSKCGKNIYYFSKGYYSCSTKKCTRIPKDILIDKLLGMIGNQIFKDNSETNEEKYPKYINPIDIEIESKIISQKNQISALKGDLKKVKTKKESSLMEYIKSIKKSSAQKYSDLLKTFLEEEKNILHGITKCEDLIVEYKLAKEMISELNEDIKKDLFIKFIKNDLKVEKAQEILKTMIKEVYLFSKSVNCDVKKIRYGKFTKKPNGK